MSGETLNASSDKHLLLIILGASVIFVNIDFFNNYFMISDGINRGGDAKKYLLFEKSL